jgi:N-methylhydantoinase B
MDWMASAEAAMPLHQSEVDELDPTTYEVLRNRFWTINIAHGETITRISGSPIFQAMDFNMTILTEECDVVVNAPFVQYLNSGSTFLCRHIMERYTEDPGISEGDIFLATDPWIGAVHQMDVCLVCPVFIDGRLFGWVSNAGHQYDLGGISPGGWPQNAPDVHSDPVVLPPIKIVEEGTIRPDYEAAYLRQSRMPDLVALDLRAQIAGCRMASERLIESCEEFGADVVKAAMRRVLEQARKALAEKLESIPNGRWSEVRYLDENLPGDRGSYPIKLNVEKRGDRLVIDNEGSSEQMPGPIGITYLAFEGGINAIINISLLHQQSFAMGGATAQLDFEPVPGLMTCVDHPAAVSGGIFAVVTHMYQFQTILGRMMICEENPDRSEIMAPGGEFPMLVFAGTNDRGVYFGTALMDPSGSGSGARGDRDGLDTSGPPYFPLSQMPNVETTEQFYPLLYLHRRHHPDSGGVGRWRGGLGFEYALTPYRATAMEVVTNSGGQSMSTNNSLGLFGAMPSPASRIEVLTGTDLESKFGAQQIPRDLGELSRKELLRLTGKSNETPLLPGDVIIATVTGGGGYGDPLEREPEQVAADVREGAVTAATAHKFYGVELDAGDDLDIEATEHRRAEIRADRAGWSPVSESAVEAAETSPATGEPPRRVHEYVVARDEGEQRVLACVRCETVLSDYRGNYRSGLLVAEVSTEVMPLGQDPAVFLDAPVRLRSFCCPGCQVQMATEIGLEGDPLLEESSFI